MTDKVNLSGPKVQSNVDRLLKHLTPEALACWLVAAHANRGSAKPVEAAKAVLLARLKQVRQTLDRPKT